MQAQHSSFDCQPCLLQANVEPNWPTCLVSWQAALSASFLAGVNIAASCGPKGPVHACRLSTTYCFVRHSQGWQAVSCRAEHVLQKLLLSLHNLVLYLCLLNLLSPKRVQLLEGVRCLNDGLCAWYWSMLQKSGRTQAYFPIKGQKMQPIWLISWKISWACLLRSEKNNCAWPQMTTIVV